MTPRPSASISIIIPVLNEAAVITGLLAQLRELHQCDNEIIVVDGGSQDDTPRLSGALADRVIITEPGRARQMNAGADIASGDTLWFLHADSRLPQDVDQDVIRQIEQALSGDSSFWGYFDVRLSGTHPMLRVIERAMNLRTYISGIATGDQGIFCRRNEFVQLGGFVDMPLMEDIELSRRFKAIRRPARIKNHLTTSSRRWEEQGIARTILLMWRLRLAYFLGAEPLRLARWYGDQR